jgi:hypothetical protein
MSISGVRRLELAAKSGLEYNLYPDNARPQRITLLMEMFTQD